MSVAHHITSTFEKILHYAGSLICDRRLLPENGPEHRTTGSMTNEERQLHFVEAYRALESIIIRHGPPATVAVFTTDSLRANVARHVSIDDLPPLARLLFVRGVDQLVYVWCIGLERMIESVIIALGEEGLREALSGDERTMLVRDVLTPDGDLDVAALHRRLLAERGDTLEVEDAAAFFAALYMRVHTVVADILDRDVADQLFVDAFVFIREHYDVALADTFARIMPRPSRESCQFLSLEGQTLRRKVSDQTRALDDTARMLTRRNDELMKMRGQLEHRVDELHKTTRELTEQERRLRESIETVHLLMNSIDEGIVATDRLGRISLINESACRMLKCTTDVRGKYWTDVAGCEDEAGRPIPFDQRPTAEVAQHLVSVSSSDLYFVAADGTRFPVALSASPITDGKEIKGAVLSFRDFTQEKELDRAKTTFVSVAAHQLRTPITAIRLASEVLLSGTMGRIDDDARKYVQDIAENNGRMIAVVSTLLIVSQMELGTMASLPQDVRITSLADKVVREFDPVVKEKGVSVSLVYAADLPVLYADPHLMELVIHHVFSNAVKYTRRGDAITITLGHEGEHLGIHIADTGVGIPEEDREKVFTKLFRAGNASKVNTEGIGMELYVAKLVVDHYGGRMWFESEEGKGSNFHILLPLRSFERPTAAGMRR